MEKQIVLTAEEAEDVASLLRGLVGSPQMRRSATLSATEFFAANRVANDLSARYVDCRDPQDPRSMNFKQKEY